MGDERPGVRITRPRVSITAAATATLVHQVTSGRTAILKKLMWYNGQSADVILEIGTFAGNTFSRRLPRIRAIAGHHDGLDELMCPNFEFEVDIYAMASAAGAAPGDIEVQCEVAEVG